METGASLVKMVAGGPLVAVFTGDAGLHGV